MHTIAVTPINDQKIFVPIISLDISTGARSFLLIERIFGRINPKSAMIPAKLTSVIIVPYTPKLLGPSSLANIAMTTMVINLEHDRTIRRNTLFSTKVFKEN